MEISVIIPVYNTEIQDLKSCLESIRTQTFTNYEIIIVDDGSKIDIAEYLDDLAVKDKKISVYHKCNEGVSEARNYGVKRANGNYVLFADADDLFTSIAFESAYQTITETNSDVAIGRILQTSRNDAKNIVNHGTGEMLCLDNEELRQEYAKHVFKKNCGSWGRNQDGWMFNFEGCWAHLARKETALKIPFDKELSIAEDTLWALKLIENARICIVDNYWYYYIQNEYSVMNKFSSSIEKTITKAIKKITPIISKADGEEIRGAYRDWLFIKLKQIVYKYYLAEELNLTMREKIKSIRKLMQSSVWTEALNLSRIEGKYKLKLLMYKTGLIIPLYRLKRGRGGEQQ